MKATKSHKKHGLLLVIKSIVRKINSIFEPEEVEVNFTIEDNQTKYTYTKVHHKQVA